MSAASDYRFDVYDLAGNRLAGLTPSWTGCDVATGAAASQPKVTDQGNGVYTAPPMDRSGPHIAGVFDFGPSALPQFRYQVYDCPTGQNDDLVFMLQALSWGPLNGLAPGTWGFCKDIVTGLTVAHPTVRGLSVNGLYAVPRIAAAGQHVVGGIDFGPTAIVRLQSYDSANLAAPIATPAAPPTPTTVVMDPLSIPLVQADFLAMFDRILPQSYLAPMKAGGDGYEYFQALGKLGERLSAAVVNLERGAWILSATEAARATVGVSFHRDGPAAIDVDLLGGTLVQDIASGRRFILTQKTTIPAGDVSTGTLQASASAPGYEYNARGPAVAANGDAIEGDISDVLRLVEDPPFGDPSLRVQQDTAGTGGTPGALEQLGSDRGLVRLSGESADQYRVRLRQLPDTISPGAVARAVAAYLAPRLPLAGKVRYFGSAPEHIGYLSGVALPPLHTVVIRVTAGGGPPFELYRDGVLQGVDGTDPAYDLGGIDVLLTGVIFHFPNDAAEGDIYAFTTTQDFSYKIIECFDEQFWGVFDAPPSNGLNPNYNPIALAFDSPFSDGQFWGRLADEADANGEFVVLVKPLPCMADSGCAFDDPATTPMGCHSALGSHGLPAYDVPAGVTWAPPAVYDGADAAQGSMYTALYNLLQSIRAAGVIAEVELAQP